LTTKIKGKARISSNHNRDIKGFRYLGSGHIDSQCSNKMIMVIRKHGDMKSKIDKSKENEMPPLEDYSDVEYPTDGKILVIRRTFNVQIQKDNVKQQMKNIFHTRCHINNRVYSMIIDSGSCVIIVITILIRKLNLNVIKYKRPYRLQM